MGFSQKNFLNYILGIALLSGIGRVILDYIPRFTGTTPMLYYLTFLIALILEIIIIIYVIKKYKNTKGTLTIADALKTGVIIMGVVGFCYCSMAYVYDVYIDPNFQTNMQLQFTEQFSPDQLNQVKENLKNQDPSKSYIGIIMYTIWFLFLGSVISLVVGSIFKTKEEIK